MKNLRKKLGCPKKYGLMSWKTDMDLESALCIQSYWAIKDYYGCSMLQLLSCQILFKNAGMKIGEKIFFSLPSRLIIK